MEIVELSVIQSGPGLNELIYWNSPDSAES
jgi:hypothetical protein